jgi:thiol peroxidase
LGNVENLSDFRYRTFGQEYDVEIADAPLAALESCVVVVVVLDEEGKVIYTQQVGEIVDVPDYEKALAAL